MQSGSVRTNPAFRFACGLRLSLNFDIERGKRSLPVVLALSRSPDPAALLRQLQARDIDTALATMETLGIRAEVEAAVNRLTAEALQHLEALGDAGDPGRALTQIARQALGRVK